MRLTIEAVAISISFIVSITGYIYHHYFKARKKRREKSRQDFIDKLRNKYNERE